MLESHWLLTCAPMGIFDDQNKCWKALGTGVFVYDDPFIWYVTANHFFKNKNLNFSVLIGHKKENKCLVDISALHQKLQIGWLIDEKNDLAATLFPSDENFMLKAIDLNFFMSTKEMAPTMSCYSISFPYSLANFDVENIVPFVQKGIISSINNKLERIYVTVPIFPGNSGGPIFVNKQPHSVQDIGFGGIISDLATIDNGDAEKLSAVPQQVGIVIPSEHVQKLLHSEKACQLKQRNLIF